MYSFRRCPYAIRARLAIAISVVEVEMREVALSNKPQELIDCSAKATVPVLQLADESVIDESRDIMLWALEKNDPDNWLPVDKNDIEETNRLIDYNDDEFKQCLDKYKYASRYPEMKMEAYRQQGEFFLKELENKLSKTKFLLNNTISLVDIAIFPFIRQFAYVDKDWFDIAEYINLQLWLNNLLNSSLFHEVMHKQSEWKSPGNEKLTESN